MAQTAHTGSFGPVLGSGAGLEGSLTHVRNFWRLHETTATKAEFVCLFPSEIITLEQHV